MKKVLALHPFGDLGQASLRSAGFDVVFSGSKDIGIGEKGVIQALKKHSPDALISFLTDSITGDVLGTCPSLKIVSNFAVGFDNIDIEAAKRMKIAVTNTPSDGYAVAEFAASLIASLARRVVEGNAFAVAGKYKGWEPELFVGETLRGKTLGIVGSGRIGSMTASIMSKGFGMKVIYSDIARNENIEKNLGAKKVELDELFRTADVVSIHVVLNDSTRHLVDARRLSLMKPSALLINTSRGAVVDEQALVSALKAKKIAGAALDVFEFEPAISRTLRNLTNVILTPHIASATKQARDDMSRVAAENIIDFFAGKKPIGGVYLP